MPAIHLRPIESQKEIKLLVDSFYKKVNKDPLLKPMFNDVAKVNWKKHLNVMYRFWGTILLHKNTYSGNAFIKHISLPITKIHFDRWIELFVETVDSLFVGEVAEEAKFKAKSMAIIFHYKLSNVRNTFL